MTRAASSASPAPSNVPAKPYQPESMRAAATQAGEAREQGCAAIRETSTQVRYAAKRSIQILQPTSSIPYGAFRRCS